MKQLYRHVFVEFEEDVAVEVVEAVLIILPVEEIVHFCYSGDIPEQQADRQASSTVQVSVARSQGFKRGETGVMQHALILNFYLYLSLSPSLPLHRFRSI